MKIQRRLKLILLITVLVGMSAFLVWFFSQGRRESGEQEEHPAKEASRVAIQGGESAVTLDKATQAESGILTAPLQSISYREELQAYGMVLELQTLVDLRKNLIDLRKNLIDLRNNHATAKAQMEKSLASLEASRKQYDRLKILYEDDRNVSEKALQEGEAVWRSDEANLEASRQGLLAAQEALRAGEETLNVLEASVRQQWGSVLTKWLFEATPAFERLIEQKDILLQITLPAEVEISSAPQSILVQTGSGATATANLVSPSPRTDPRIQGMSFLYVAPSQTGFSSGMNVRAYLPVGKKFQGVLVPETAVLLWQGKAWIYVQRGSEQFDRREVPTKNPVKGGYFVQKGFRAGDKIAVKGAQLLLSKEFLPQTQGKEEEDKD
jgi:hypothetical protein